jgi:hypothetical protein
MDARPLSRLAKHRVSKSQLKGEQTALACDIAWLHQLSMRPRGSCRPREYCLRCPMFYCAVRITEAELLAMFESQ